MKYHIAGCMGEQMSLMLAPRREQSRRISEMTHGVLEPAIRQYRERTNQMATTITAQLPTLTVPRPTTSVINFGRHLRQGVG